MIGLRDVPILRILGSPYKQLGREPEAKMELCMASLVTSFQGRKIIQIEPFFLICRHTVIRKVLQVVVISSDQFDVFVVGCLEGCGDPPLNISVELVDELLGSKGFISCSFIFCNIVGSVI